MQTEPSSEKGHIGIAWMEPDGTIKLKLRAVGPAGIKGDGLLSYPANHEQYQSILDHIGPLQPGETVPVLPWPD